MKNNLENELNTENIARLRNHLLLQLAFENGKRTGTFSDWKTEEFFAPQKEGHGCVSLIGEGKTLKVIGTAGIYVKNRGTYF